MVEPSWSAKVTHGLITSMTAVPRCAKDALRSGRSCFWSPENERATNPQPSWMAIAQQSIGISSFTLPVFMVLPTSAVAEKPLFSMM